MKTILNVIYVDNSDDGAAVVNTVLIKGNVRPNIWSAATRDEFVMALAEFPADIILSEYRLPDFDYREALRIARGCGISVPFIILSDNISDEMVPELLLMGVDDYVLKNQPGRLPFAIAKSLEKYEAKMQQQILLEQLANSEKRFRALADYSADAVVVLNKESQASYASPSVKNVLGYTPQEVMNMDVFSKIHPDDLEELSKIMVKVLANPGLPIQGHTGRMLHKDGSWRWIEATVTNLLHEPAINGIVDNFRDITLKKASEANILHLNRLYAFLSRVNHALVHAPDEHSLFKELCRIACDAGNFQAAWVGMMDANNKIIPVESWVIKSENLEGFAGTANDQEDLNSYLQSHPYYLSNNIEQQYISDDWKAWAVAAGYNSCMLLPIRRSGNIVGSFNLYASETGFFTTDDVTLLEEATSGICFALDYFEKERSKNLADERLRHKERRLTQAQEIAHLGSWELDLATDTVVWSDESCRIHGVDEKENTLSTSSWLSFVHPQDVESVIKISINALDSRQGADYYHRIIREGGEIRYLHVQTHIELDSQGLPVCVYGILHDITEVELSRQALQKSESNLYAIMDNTDAFIYSLDTDLKLITYNQALANMMHERYGIIIKPGHDIRESMERFDPGSEKEWEQINARAFNGEILKFEKAFPYKGASSHLQFSIHPIKENGTVTGLSCFVNDMTRERNYANELIASNKGLEQFSYIVSHNLRAPVANIIGLAGLIDQDIYPAKVKEEFLQGILVNVKRLDTVISDLNTILQTKREVSEKREVVFLQQLINEILSSIQNIIQQERVEIKTDFSAVGSIFTLKSYLHSIFYNLIINSIKYRQSDIFPVILIKSSLDLGQVIISVQDNGMGIDLVKKGSQLFGMYRRFHHHVEGKGMGLFMVKTQIEMLGGEVEVKSEVNKGTEFKIRLRLNDPQIPIL